MIGKLKGLIDSYGEDFVIVDVNGVGYVICNVRRAHCRNCRPSARPRPLAIETQVREDAIRLFGFSSDAERDWFGLLQACRASARKWRCHRRACAGELSRQPSVRGQDGG